MYFYNKYTITIIILIIDNGDTQCHYALDVAQIFNDQLVTLT